MAFDVCKLSRLQLGKQGENEATVIDIDVTDWLNRWPEAVIQLIHVRHDEDIPYEVTSATMSGGFLSWKVTSKDTAIPGKGIAEVRAIEGDMMKKSRMIETIVDAAVEGTTGEVPDPLSDWAAKLGENAEKAEQAAEKAEDALTTISGWANATATAVTLPADKEATAEVQKTPDGNVVAFGIPRGLQGQPGNPGYTPQKGVDYFDGEPGEDGISPTITTSKSGKVTTLTIKDVSGTKTATISDGADGYTPVKGKDYSDGAPGVSATHKWNGTTLTITSASGTSSADLKGDPGDPGSDATVTQESVTNALGYTPADAAAVFELAAEPLFENFFDASPIEYGKIINTDGTVSDTEAALAITDFIPIKAGDVIRMADFGLYPSGSCRLVVYNSEKNYIIHAQATSLPASNYYIQAEKQDADGNWVEFTVVRPSAGGYVRICTNPAAIGKNPVLTINQEIAYTETYGSVLNPRVKVDHSQITNSPQKNGWSILPYEHLNICYSGINRKPINTVEHFVDAAENFGYNALKCDVRPTSDGELVCCHDAGFTFDSSGYITSYDSANQTKIHDVTASTCLGYSHKTGEHPCLVGDYLDVCRKYGKVAFVTIRNEYMDVVIPKLMEELRSHNMTYATIINCMTYESLVQWRQQDQTVMINYTLNYGVAIDQAQIDRAIGLGYCSLCGFSLSSASTEPSASCDFEYARANGVRLLEAIAYKEGSPEACYALGYDGCQIGIPWGTASGGVSEDSVQTMIDNAIGAAIGGSY